MTLSQRLTTELIGPKPEGKCTGVDCPGCDYGRAEAALKSKIEATIATIEADLKGLVEDEDTHTKLRWVIAHFKTFGLTDEDGNDVETALGDLFDPDELIAALKPVQDAAIEHYTRDK